MIKCLFNGLYHNFLFCICNFLFERPVRRTSFAQGDSRGLALERQWWQRGKWWQTEKRWNNPHGGEGGKGENGGKREKGGKGGKGENGGKGALS